MRSPTERSLKLARERGYSPLVVEKWTYIPVGGGLWKPHRRHDVWGFDIQCAHPTRRPLYIQTTSSTNHSARVTKLTVIPEVKMLVPHVDLEIHSWGIRKREGREFVVGRIEALVLDALGELQVERLDDVWSSRPRPRKASPAERTSLIKDLYFSNPEE